MATTLNRTFYGGSTVPGSGVYPEDVKILKVFANYAETDYDPLSSSDTSVYIPTVDKHQYDDGNIVSIIDRILAAGGSPIITKLGAEFTYTSGDADTYKFVNVSGDNITEMTIDRSTGTVTTRNNFLARPVEVEYGVSTASDVASIISINCRPYVNVGNVITGLYKIETNKYTFRTTHLRNDGDANYLDIVDYIVNGSTWTTVTKTVSSAEAGATYLKKVSSPSSFDTTGQSGMKTVASVNDVPSDGVYQVSVMLSVTPKTANATKSDLVFGFYGADGIGMADHTFHAVVDDSQTFAQQLSFSTTLNLKAGSNSLKLSCNSLNTNYLVFVDDLTVAQLVNGVYHNGDDFDDVHTLAEAPDFNEDDGVLIDGATGGPRFMFWKTLANKVLGFFGIHKENNNEFLYAVTDRNDKFLFGIRTDGSVEWQKGVPTPVKDQIQNVLNLYLAQQGQISSLGADKVDKELNKGLISTSVASIFSIDTRDENYLIKVNDTNGVFLFGIAKDGSFIYKENRNFYCTTAVKMHYFQLKVGDIVYTTGFYEPDDGGASAYEIVDDAVANGKDILTVGVGLQAKLINTKLTICIEQIGAKRNETPDSQTYINFAYSRGYKTVRLLYGYYLTNGPIVVPGGCRLLGNGVSDNNKSVISRTTAGLMIQMSERSITIEDVILSHQFPDSINTASCRGIDTYSDSGDHYDYHFKNVYVFNCNIGIRFWGRIKWQFFFENVRVSRCNVGMVIWTCFGINLCGFYTDHCEESGLVVEGVCTLNCVNCNFGTISNAVTLKNYGGTKCQCLFESCNFEYDTTAINGAKAGFVAVEDDIKCNLIFINNRFTITPGLQANVYSFAFSANTSVEMRNNMVYYDPNGVTHLDSVFNPGYPPKLSIGSLVMKGNIDLNKPLYAAKYTGVVKYEEDLPQVTKGNFESFYTNENPGVLFFDYGTKKLCFYNGQMVKEIA